MIKVYIIESSNAAAIAAAGDGSQSRLQVERDGSEWFLGVLVVFFVFFVCVFVFPFFSVFFHLFVNKLSDSLLWPHGPRHPQILQSYLVFSGDGSGGSFTPQKGVTGCLGWGKTPSEM